MRRTTMDQHGSDLKCVSRKLFFLAAYSLTGAALMGSSVGLVVYQNRQYFFIDQYNGHGIAHRSLLHNQQTQDDDSPLPSGASSYQQLLHHHPRYHYHRHHKNLSFLFYSSLLPILIWIGTLVACSVLIASRKWIPKVLSPRTGILMSQCIFSIFWIFSGAIQEVQETLVSQSSALKALDPITEAMEDSSQLDDRFETRSRIQAMKVPLCTVWYLTVVLLGLATGLLTTSSTVLEMQLHDAYEMVQLEAQEQEGEAKVLHHVARDQKCHQETSPRKRTLRYSMSQRTILGAIVLILFSAQVKFFHWIIQSQSVAAHMAGTATPVSSCLTIAGLMTGAVMIAIGTRLLPQTSS